MADCFTKTTTVLIIVSIIISALFVRIVYAWFDSLILFAEQTFDEDYRDNYYLTTNSIGSSVVVTCVCLFLIIVVYQLWIRYG